MNKLFFLCGFWLMAGLLMIATAQTILVEQTFSADAAIKPFTGNNPVYSVKMTGAVELLSDSSLVRVVLIDYNSNHYLLYEAYPLITTSKSFNVDGVCDETGYLNGIVPDSIRIDIINANITIDVLNVETGYILNATELQAQAKWLTDSLKISVMNQRIQQEHMYWRAGRTPLTSTNFEDKEHTFGQKFNIAGFDYYKGGIFEFLYRKYSPGTSFTSTMVDEFDWRTRHDASLNTSHYFNPDGDGWITHPENQSVCGSCYVFSVTHTFADFINIHCNQMFNYNLSEEEALVCTYSGTLYDCGNCSNGGSPYCVLDYIQYHGIHQEAACSTYLTSPSPPCSTVCWGNSSLNFTNIYSAIFTEDQLMQVLIKKGPVTCILDSTIFPPKGHAMELFAYKIIRAGDTVYINSYDTIIVGGNSNLIGHVSWIFKNSLDPTQYFRYYGQFGTITSRHALSGIVKKTNGSSTDTIAPVCRDKDGDGYFWWGVGDLITNCGCPPGVNASEEDCNDNDPNVGPYVTESDSSINLPLYSCRPNDCITQSTTKDIYGDSIWTHDRHIDQNIVIHTGGRLIVRGQVFLSPGAKIIVQSQGLLILSGVSAGAPARLSSGCGQMWNGVELLGDPLYGQDTIPAQFAAQHQGTIIIHNGIIENALCGIKTFNSGAYPDFGGGDPLPVGYPSGGVILADSATFRNNKIAVEFYPYRHGGTPNRSFFRACKFLTNDALLNNTRPECFLKLNYVNKIEILGCSFKNKYYLTPTSPAYNERGIGIYAYNADLFLDTLFRSNTTIKTEFEDLERGIYALHSGLGQSSISVQNCKFNSNHFGAYFSGYREVTPLEIKNNKFKLTENFGADTLYCLYLDNCSGYKVTKNEFDGSGFSGTGNKLGIIVNNSGARTNYIYNNGPFTALTNALQGQNINRGIYTPDGWDPGPLSLETGLHFVCNHFDNCKNDIVINENLNSNFCTGIDFFQRNAGNAIGTQQPAGNRFSLNHTSSNPNLFDVDIDANVGNIQYKYHSNPTNSSILRLYPDRISIPDKVSYDQYTLFSFDTISSCPDSFYPIGTPEELQLQIQETDLKIDSLSGLILLLIDGGSTDTLKNTVTYSSYCQSFEVYSDLLNASPYLSDTVLKSSILKEEVLPNAMIRDVMVANPQSAKNEDLLNTLGNRNNPMPDSMWAEILQGKDSIGALGSLKSELSGWIQKRDLYFNELINHFLMDTINPDSSDSLMNLLTNDHDLNSKYNLITWYLNRYDFNEALSTLQDIPNQFTLTNREQFTRSNFISLVSILEQLYNDTLGYKKPDSIQVISLRALALDDYSLPATLARNILIASCGFSYHEPILLETTLKSSKIFQQLGKEKKSLSEFKVFPNPCKDYIIVEYKKNRNTDEVTFSIINFKGSFLASYSLQKTSNQVVIPFKIYLPGCYFLKMQVNGKSVGSYQIVKIN